MDKNLVEMLKEPIKLHQENNDIKDQNNMIARNIQSPNQGSSLPTPTPMGGEPIKWDNNATVALKLLYASCMNEGNIFLVQHFSYDLRNFCSFLLTSNWMKWAFFCTTWFIHLNWKHLHEVILFSTRHNWNEKRRSSSKAVDRWIWWLASVGISGSKWFQVEWIDFWLAGIQIFYGNEYASFFTGMTFNQFFLHFFPENYNQVTSV